MILPTQHVRASSFEHPEDSRDRRRSKDEALDLPHHKWHVGRTVIRDRLQKCTLRAVSGHTSPRASQKTLGNRRRSNGTQRASSKGMISREAMDEFLRREKETKGHRPAHRVQLELPKPRADRYEDPDSEERGITIIELW